jgi:hypothetical protein
VFIDAKRNKSNLENIKVGQEILAMGINDSKDNIFTARRIVITDLSTISIKKTTVIGKIVDISKTAPIFTLIPIQNKNTLFQIKLDSSTALTNGSQKVMLIPNLKSGDKIIAVLTPDEKMTKTYYAEKIIDFDYVPNALSPTPTKKP